MMLLQIRLLEQNQQLQHRHKDTLNTENALYHRLRDLRRRRQYLSNHWISLEKSIDSGTLALQDFSWLEDIDADAEEEENI